MTKSGDPFSSFQRAVAQEDQLKALCAKYEDYLAIRGLRFGEESEAERLQTAKCRIRLVYIAATKLVMEAAKEGRPESEVASISSEFRISVVSSLWYEGLWESPWIELINKEFPGPDLTDDGIEWLIARAGDEADGQLRSASENRALCEEIMDFFHRRGYDLEGKEILLLMSAVPLIDLARRRISEGQEPGPLQVGQLQAEIHESASQPDHPVWQQFLATYFPSHDH